MNRGRILSAAMAVLLLPAAAEPQPAAPCEGAAAERSALQAERSALDRAVSDIALGRRKKRKVGGGEVAAGVVGAAASVLLPFGVGALLGVGAKAAAKSGRKRKPAPPAPDVRAMIERLDSIDVRLAALAGCV